MIDYGEIKKRLLHAQNVVTISHHNPDGDAIGSSLAIKYFLEKLDHKVTSIVPNAYADFLKYLDNGEDIFVFNDASESLTKVIESADIIFFLDFNALSRIGVIGEIAKKSNAFKILIDHHLHPEDIADFVLSDISASSTCELVYRFIDKCNLEQYVDAKVVNAIYLGILTDTGNFNHSVTSELHEVVAKLIRKGADIEKTKQAVFMNHSLNRMRLWGYCLGKKLEIVEDLPAAIISLSKKEIYKYNVKKGDTEGLVNQPLAIKDVVLSILLIEESDRIKLSLRSIGDFSVNEMATKYFEGGGHKNASGGRLFTSMESAISKVKSVILEHKQELTNQINT